MSSKILSFLCLALGTAFSPSWVAAQSQTKQWPGQSSNLYPSRLAPLPEKRPDQPAQLLNFVAPTTTQAKSKTQDRLPSFSNDQNQPTNNLDDLLRKQSEQETSGAIDLNLRPARTGVEVVRQRYPDGKIQVERDVVQDADGNYQNHGAWKLYNNSGQVIAQGMFANGLMEGPWNRLHAQAEEGIFSTKPFSLFQGPYLSTATFDQGKIDGLWQIYDRNQRKIMEIGYTAGKRQGTASWWFPNGMKMREMRFIDGILDGKFVERNEKNEIVRDEEYIEGRKVTKESQYYSQDRRRTENYFLEARLVPDGSDDWWDAKPAGYKTEGERYQHGPVSAWFENGQLEMQGQFDENQRVGPLVMWHANGQKKLVGTFEKNQRVGVWTWWHANGMKASEGRFEGDEPIGQWISWNDAGKVEDRKNFTDELPAPKPNDESKSQADDTASEKAEPAEPIQQPVEEIDLINPMTAPEDVDFLENVIESDDPKSEEPINDGESVEKAIVPVPILLKHDNNKSSLESENSSRDKSSDDLFDNLFKSIEHDSNVGTFRLRF